MRAISPNNSNECTDTSKFRLTFSNTAVSQDFEIGKRFVCMLNGN